MITIIKDKNPNHIFAALKLCEQLYHDGKIPLYMFRNTLQIENSAKRTVQYYLLILGLLL